MQYHVAKNGDKLGPFEQEEVYRRLVAGEFSGGDLGWHEGLAQWTPLSTLLPPLQPRQATVPENAVFGPSITVGIPQSESGKSSGLAVGSMICGILGLIFWLPCLPAVILGHMGLSNIKKSAGALKGRGMAITGLVTGYLMIAAIPIFLILLSMTIPAMNRVQSRAKEMKMIVEAKHLMMGIQNYAADHEGHLPPTLETLVEEGLVMNESLLFDSRIPAGQGWEYLGAGIKDTAYRKTLILTTLKTVSPGKELMGYLDGSVEVIKRK